jgi:hypothetical protein
MTQRVLKADYGYKIREAGEAEYKSKLSLELNKAKEAYVLADSDLKVYSSRPVMDNVTVWLDQLKQMELEVAKKKAFFEEKENFHNNYRTSAEFQKYMLKYQMNQTPTEDDYETVKMANQYGIVEED